MLGVSLYSSFGSAIHGCLRSRRLSYFMAFGAEFELKSGAVIRVDTGRLELVNPAPYLKVSR